MAEKQVGKASWVAISVNKVGADSEVCRFGRGPDAGPEGFAVKGKTKRQPLSVQLRENVCLVLFEGDDK
jgi:hypothetical protein